MKSITIATGITLTATAATIAAYEVELKAAAAEERDLRTLDELEKLARETGNWYEYSDFYKDMYGIRPTWLWAS